MTSPLALATVTLTGLQETFSRNLPTDSSRAAAWEIVVDGASQEFRTRDPSSGMDGSDPGMMERSVNRRVWSLTGVIWNSSCAPSAITFPEVAILGRIKTVPGIAANPFKMSRRFHFGLIIGQAIFQELRG